MVTKEELRAAASDMGVNLYEDQEDDIWDDVNKKILLNEGRKCGKTATVEFRQARILLNLDVKANGVRGGLAIAGDESQGAQLILQGAADVLEVLGWQFTSDRTKKSQEKQIFYLARNELQMPNGNRSLVLTSKFGGRTIRKYSFYELDIDEADLIPNEAQFYEAIKACMARYDGTLLLESTPNLEGNRKTYFAKAFFGQEPGWKVRHIPTTARPHISAEWIKREYAGKAREYQREILAMYVSDIGAVFPNEIIQSCFSETPIEWQADVAFIGAQYASFQTDTSVIAENFYKDGICNIRIGLIPHFARRITEVENEIATMVTRSGIRRVVINTTMGTAPLQSMAELIGAEMVVGVANHDIVQEMEGVRKKYMKEDLYVNMLKLMERGRIRFDDRRIVEAFMDVKHDYNKRSKQLYIIGNDITDAIARAIFPIWGRTEWLESEKPKIFFEKYK